MISWNLSGYSSPRTKNRRSYDLFGKTWKIFDDFRNFSYGSFQSRFYSPFPGIILIRIPRRANTCEIGFYDFFCGNCSCNHQSRHTLAHSHANTYICIHTCSVLLNPHLSLICCLDGCWAAFLASSFDSSIRGCSLMKTTAERSGRERNLSRSDHLHIYIRLD